MKPVLGGLFALIVLACMTSAGSPAPASPIVEVARLVLGKAAVTTMGFASDDDVLACGTRDDMLHVWRIPSDTASLVREGGGLVAYVRRGGAERLLVVGRKGNVSIYDPATMRRDEWISQRGSHAALTPDGRVLATADADVSQPIRLWNLRAAIPSESVAELPRLQGLSATITGIVLGPDAGYVVMAGTLPGGAGGIAPEGFVLFWNRQLGGRPDVVRENSAVLQVAASSDRTRIAVVGYEGDAEGPVQIGRISIWDTSSRRRLLTLPPQPKAVTSAAFQAATTLLATGGADGVVRLWDSATGRMRATIKTGPSPVGSLTFSGRGQRLAVGTEDGTVRVYDVSEIRL